MTYLLVAAIIFLAYSFGENPYQGTGLAISVILGILVAISIAESIYYN